jgi:hypothetical protein
MAKDELVRIHKAAVVAYLKHLPEETEESHEKPQVNR